MPYTLDERLFIIESTTLNTVLDVSGEYRRGVQMINMSQRLDGYEGDAWWFPLKNPLNQDEKIKMVEWLFQKYASKIDYDEIGAAEAGIDLEDSWWRFLGLSWLFKKKKESLNSLFCSELCTKALKIAGRIDESINSSEITPADLSKFDIFKEKVKIL